MIVAADAYPRRLLLVYEQSSDVGVGGYRVALAVPVGVRPGNALKVLGVSAAWSTGYTSTDEVPTLQRWTPQRLVHRFRRGGQARGANTITLSL